MEDSGRGNGLSAGRLLRSVLPAALMCLCASGCGSRESPSPRISLAETRRIENLATGKFLVASPDISDDAFARTVILLVRYDQRGTAGLILNRVSSIPVSQALKGLSNAPASTGSVYLGGPVGQTAVLALLRSRSTPSGARRILEGCQLISDADLLNKQLGAGATSENLRVYLGYTGWAAGQLEREIEAGEWLIFPGETRLVFDPHPETLWSRLIGRLEQQLANYSTPAVFYTQCSDFHFHRSTRS
ncbi:MAG: YqgE/AlgH family protein [Bryobacteraceae bacterium]|nr:YqgE/AlgH family protein [Bryobacteraceae bacterium]